MLGQAVCSAIQESGHEVQALEGRIQIIHPLWIKSDIVINCAGRISQKPRLDSDFISSNAYGPHLLADTCDLIGVRLIHVSTDCVFSHPGPHLEQETVSPVGIYGLSKAAGEITRAPHLTVRTSFIGLGPHGLLHDLMQPGKQIRASAKLLWSGHTVETVARTLVYLAVEHPGITGVLHIPGEFRSRFTLAWKLKDIFDLPAEIIQDDSFVSDRRLASKTWDQLSLKMPPSFVHQLSELCSADDEIS